MGKSVNSPRGFGVAFCLFSLIFIALGVREAHVQAHAIRTYLPVRATVLSRSIKTVSGSDNDTYAPVVNYRYQVNSRTYECHDVTVGAESTSSYDWAKDMIRDCVPGAVVQAYYDPAAPGKAFLVHNASFFPYAFGLFAMIFFCVGWAMMTTGTTPSARHTGSLLSTLLIWNGVGAVAAWHYFSLSPVMDLFAKIGFSIYVLIGALMAYAWVYLMITRPADESQ